MAETKNNQSIAQFGWKAGFPSHKVKAEDVGRILLELRDKRGTIEPEDLVKEAKKKKNRAILAPFFTFDVKKAAHLHNLEEARGIIRAIEIQYVIEEVGYKVRAFHHVQTENTEGSSYLHIDDVLRSELATADMVEKARRELESWYRTYHTIVALVEASEHVKAALIKLSKKRAGKKKKKK